MAQGFIKNRTQPTVGTSVTTIEIGQTVSTDDGHDARSRSLPNAGSLSHLDLIFTGVAEATAVTFDLNITYDSAGKDPVLPPLTTSTTTNTLNTLSPIAKVAVVDMGVRFFFNAPSTQTTAGSLYAHVKTTHSITLDTLRIHWHDKV